MRLYKTDRGIFIERDGKFYRSQHSDWDTLINRDDLYATLQTETTGAAEADIRGATILAPVGTQEVWAAGVTYKRSKEARMKEASLSGSGGDFYAKVYEADRPELFFKATAWRVVPPFGQVNIRRDAHWNVPEPELTLYATSSAKIVGYTIGNDMSSRDIEGVNPLYLPQAKYYDGSTAIGPALYVPESPIDPDTEIAMEIDRDAQTVFQGKISINQMKRTHRELIDYLFRELTFPVGVFLLTGTCLVPPDEFTLRSGDVVRMTIPSIGVLQNTVGMREG